MSIDKRYPEIHTHIQRLMGELKGEIPNLKFHNVSEQYPRS